MVGQRRPTAATKELEAKEKSQALVFSFVRGRSKSQRRGSERGDTEAVTEAAIPIAKVYMLYTFV